MLRWICWALGAATLFWLGFVVGQANGAGLHTMRLGGNVYVYVPPTITGVSFGTPFQYNNSNWAAGHYVNGDGMSNTWASDDNTYINLDDTLGTPPGTTGGFDGGVSGGANTMFGQMTTYDTTGIGANWPTATTTMAVQWGGFNDCTTGSTNHTASSSHKIAGVISVAGTMYALAWRLDCNQAGGFDGNLLKSTDHATTWTPAPPSTAAQYASPMFPGSKIPMGFVQYGKDYSGNYGAWGTVSPLPDNAANYVYAMVIDDAKNASGRQDEWLARVPVASIVNQSVGDWQYWNGAADGGGTAVGDWGTLAQAVSLIHLPLTTGSTAIYYWNVVYLPKYQQYLAINDADQPSNQTWTPYTAPHPWGPWTALASTTFSTYQNSFPNPVIRSLTVDGGHTMYVYGSGQTSSQDPHTGYYTLWIIQATVSP